MDYSEYSVDLSIEGEVVDNNIAILNSFFKFKNEFMSEYSILDALKEYAAKYDYNVIELAQELSEIPGFVDICQNDCKKFKYNIIQKTDNIGDEWE
jgi:hypothetical protein